MAALSSLADNKAQPAPLTIIAQPSELQTTMLYFSCCHEQIFLYIDPQTEPLSCTQYERVKVDDLLTVPLHTIGIEHNDHRVIVESTDNAE